MGKMPSISQECLRLPETNQRAWNRYSYRACRRSNPADILILDFQPPELGDNKLLLLKPPSQWFFVIAAAGT